MFAYDSLYEKFVADATRHGVMVLVVTCMNDTVLMSGNGAMDLRLRMIYLSDDIPEGDCRAIVGWHELGHFVTMTPEWRDVIRQRDAEIQRFKRVASEWVLKEQIAIEEAAWDWAMTRIPDHCWPLARRIRQFGLQSYREYSDGLAAERAALSAQRRG